MSSVLYVSRQSTLLSIHFNNSYFFILKAYLNEMLQTDEVSVDKKVPQGFYEDPGGRFEDENLNYGFAKRMNRFAEASAGTGRVGIKFRKTGVTFIG